MYTKPSHAGAKKATPVCTIRDAWGGGSENLTGILGSTLTGVVCWSAAPYMLKWGGWWYLFYSGNGCCGLSCSYALGVARARGVLGPWDKNPGNPILAGNEEWQCPGHGTVASTPEGRHMLIYHAVSAQDKAWRQPLVDEVWWDGDGQWRERAEERAGDSADEGGPAAAP
jgi:beta-xylosidase